MTRENTNQSGLRMLEILKLMKGRSLTGLAHSEIAQALKAPRATISRDLATLEKAGMVAKLESERWALSTAILQIAVAHSLEMQKAQERLDQLNARINAGAF